MHTLSIQLPNIPTPEATTPRIAKLPWRAGLKWTGVSLAIMAALTVTFGAGLLLGMDSANRSYL